MLSQPKNRVQAIKSKFENLSVETKSVEPKPVQIQSSYLYRHKNECDGNKEKARAKQQTNSYSEPYSSDETSAPEPNFSYLYKSEVKRTFSAPKPLSRQLSDPGKKLHRSHAFRCDRAQKVTSPKRAGSVNSRPEAKMDRKLSKDKLKRLGDVLDEQMRKENFQFKPQVVGEVRQVGFDSIPDENVPPHILAQYAKVIKPKKQEDKNEAMTDSGVSSETENLEEEKGRVKKISSQFENPQLESMEKKYPLIESGNNQYEGQNIMVDTANRFDGPSHKFDEVTTDFDSVAPLFDHVGAQTIKFNCPDKILANIDYENSANVENEKTEYLEIKTNLNTMDNLASSYETVKLERKNPHLVLTDTLKKALKQPLPAGPPPKKPPRTFNVPTIPENEKKDTKRKLEKLEQVFKQREAAKQDTHVIAEEITPKDAICDVSLEKTSKIPANIYDVAKDITSKKTDNIYDIAEDDLSLKHPKEVHYLCTEILDITQRSSPNQNRSPLKNCFKLNCATPTYSMLSLPYTRLSTESDFSQNPIKNCCSSSTDSLHQRLVNEKCVKCLVNDDKAQGFKCHLNCKCRVRNSEFYTDEHIYDEPCVSDEVKVKSKYGTLNNVGNVGAFSKSYEDLREKERKQETIYEILTDFRPSTPDPISPKLQKSDFQKLLQNFENRKPEPTNKTRSKRSLEQLKLSNVPEEFACDGKSYPVTPEVTNLPRPDLLLKFEGKISPRCDGKISPKFEGKISPKFDGKISPKFEGKISPKFEEKISKIETGKLSLDAKLAKDEFEVGKAEVKFAKKEKKFFTEVRRYKPERNLGYSLPRKNPQLDVDRENLNALMNEIYETVTAACNMENKPGSFPTDQAEGSASEESVKLTRSLTEKRKNYVRRVSSRLAYIEPKNIGRYRHQTSICSYKSDVLNLTDASDNKYSTFRSWKSFRASQSNLKMDSDSKYNLTDSTGNILTLKNDFNSTPSIDIDTESIDERAGCVHIEVPFSRERQLFSVCLLVAIDGQQEATRKLTFPSQVQVPQHIENLIFPETLTEEMESSWSVDAASTQCYSFILTDERGERSYGYCRRVLPEGATECLPLCYCLIGKFRAPGFYYKVLQLIESHHGVSQTTMDNILQQLWECELPCPGESLNLTFDDADTDIIITDDCVHRCITEDTDDPSDNNNCKCTSVKCKSEKKADQRISERFYDPENNNSLRELMLSLDGVRVKTIPRPLEVRAEETSACTLLDSLGAGLLVKVFGSLLLERKLIVRADKLSVLSSLLEGLQSALYPFVWQQPLISCVPSEIQRAVLDAPLPVLAGVLARTVLTDTMEEGMFIDLSYPTLVRCYQGDESSILPTDSYKTLKTALNMDSVRNKDRDDTKTRNVMISEAFLRFFVDILGDFWRFFSIGALKEGDMGKEDVVFDKEAFIKNATSKQNQYFLEWFTETAMFNHFIQNMAVRYKQTEPDSFRQNDSCKSDSSLVDAPTPNYYQLFEERVNSRRTRANVDRSGYKSALNKRVKLLKARLKDLIG